MHLFAWYGLDYPEEDQHLNDGNFLVWKLNVFIAAAAKWAWSERARQLSNRQKDYLKGLAIAFFSKRKELWSAEISKAQGIVVMRERKI